MAIVVTAIAGALIFGAVVAVRQVDHVNSCDQYAHELGAAIDDPANPDFNGLPPAVAKAAKKSDSTFENDGGTSPTGAVTSWEWYSKAFVDDGMSVHGC